MRILVITSTPKEGSIKSIHESLDYVYLACALRDAGHKVFCLDLQFTNDALAVVERTVRTTAVDVCTIGCQLPIAFAQRIFRAARCAKPDIIVIAKSDESRMEASDERAMGEGGADIGVSGVGEDGFVEICAALAEKRDPMSVRGAICKDRLGNIRRAPQRRTITRLDYDVVPSEAPADGAFGSVKAECNGERPINLDAYAHRVITAHWAPRDEAAAMDFVRDRLPASKIMIYGAGTHTAKLIDVLARRSDITILAVLDRNASGDGTFQGYPLCPPQSARRSDVDHVVVAHPVWEMDMVGALLRQGVPIDTLFQVYSSPAYLSKLLAPSIESVLTEVGGGGRNLVIGSAKWGIISDAELAEALPPGQTVKLHFDSTDPFAASPIFRTIDLRRSYALLNAVIRHVQPTTIYLRTHIGSNLLGYIIRRMAPEARLIHELYDFASLLSDHMLFGWMERSPEAISACKSAEEYSIKNSDLIISKRDGRSWQRFLRQFTAPYHVFYAGKAALSVRPPFPSPKRPIRILYAGILPKPDLLSISLCDYNFLPLLESLASTGKFEISIYNYLHDGPGMDYLFGVYLERFSGSALRYHRCIPYEELIELAGDFDYGWLYRDAPQEDNPDARIVVGQRFTSYLFAGLPLILDEGWESMIDLVQKYGAGLVIKSEDRHRLAEIIVNADYPALASGANHLRMEMIAHNQTVLKNIADLAVVD